MVVKVDDVRLGKNNIVQYRCHWAAGTPGPSPTWEPWSAFYDPGPDDGLTSFVEDFLASHPKYQKYWHRTTGLSAEYFLARLRGAL